MTYTWVTHHTPLPTPIQAYIQIHINHLTSALPCQTIHLSTNTSAIVNNNKNKILNIFYNREALQTTKDRKCLGNDTVDINKWSQDPK